VERRLRKLLPDGIFQSVPSTRSRNMRAIPGSGNKTTERRFRFALVAAGLRGWTTRNRAVFGNPDFLFPKAKLAVFVDGCFWHGCPACGHVPRTRRQYWGAKIARNRQRDRKVTRRLRALGLRVLRFWEHDLNRLDHCIGQVLMAIEEYPPYLTPNSISKREKQAVARVRRAGVRAPVSAVVSWIRSIRPESVLSATLTDIRAIANAF
jgi:DNA mismatch endonuclease (patch repair protein)